ncbi:MAG: FliO/MopB family protein [Rhodospirillales bacterium]|jgi:flagellar protein FliO/FliZ|nr:FliO/MopB family protein [Rhodospirillales bacterium]MBT4039439.1 FliO/MopB family protein [Rhodospirillales bacterium]MBT4626581.1 FliO/MopB family protein [Rhodospirillales bacterium]MBT5352427.1 FliO/MopB family protein [Rhodospirillales bacterium]MBT5520441.1 FliO/MopB family protein [Rhodospirillales bacterium]
MDYTNIAQAFLALIFVLGLIGVVAVVARRLGLGVPTPTLRTKNKRVTVVEVTIIDSKRRLVLVRRDDQEHLILLGATTEQVVETGIKAGQTPLQSTLDSLDTNTTNASPEITKPHE